MYVDELLETAKYVTDHAGKRQSVVLDIDIWESLLKQLEFIGSDVDTDRQKAMAREEAAYQSMHEELYAKYNGQYVAIYREQLVDQDVDGGRLYARVRQQYADEFVLITPVEPEAEETYQIFSPRVTVEDA